MKDGEHPDDPNLQQALASIRATMRNHGLAGAVMLVAENEAAYSYVMDAPWSAIHDDPAATAGFTIIARSSVEGDAISLAWMQNIMATLATLDDAGVSFDYVPFTG